MSDSIPQREKHPPCDTGDWATLVAMLPKGLDALAQQHGALRRRRQIRSAETQLRLLMLWVLSGFGLRSVAAWAARAELALVTEGALRHRFRQSRPWIEALLAAQLSSWLDARAGKGAPLRLVDASMVAIPGGSGKCWRIHAVYDPLQTRLVEVEITDDKEGESLTRAKHAVGDLVVADRGLAHAAQLVALSNRDVWWIVRAQLPNIVLNDGTDRRIEVSEITERAEHGDHETAVKVVAKKQGCCEARLVVIPLPPGKAEIAREKLRKRAAKKGKSPDAVALHLAGYVCLLTDLPEDVADSQTVLFWYRIRWQIELFFKRCKSLLNLHVIQSQNEEMVRVYLLTMLLVASMIDRLNGTQPTMLADESGAQAVVELDSLEVTATSLWRLTQIHRMDLLLAVANSVPLDRRLLRREAADQRLRERARKRHETSSVVALEDARRRLRALPAYTRRKRRETEAEAA